MVAVAYWRCGRLLEVPTVRLFDWESFGGLDRRSLTRRGRLLEIPTLRVLVFWIGGRLLEVVAPGGSTVFTFSKKPIRFTRKIVSTLASL